MSTPSSGQKREIAGSPLFPMWGDAVDEAGEGGKWKLTHTEGIGAGEV